MKLTGLSILLFPFAVDAQSRSDLCGWGGWGPMMGWGGGMFSLFGGFFMLIFWILIIGSIVFLIRYLMSEAKKNDNRDALSILKKRFAQGEISKEEYDRMKEDLK